MKKHRRDRLRPQARAPAPKESPTPVTTKGATLRPIGWVAGVGLVLALGFLVFRTPRSSIAPSPALAGATPSLTIPPPSSAPAPPAAAAQEQENTQSPPSVPPPTAPTDGLPVVESEDAKGQAIGLNNQGAKLLDGGDPKGAIPILQQAQALLPTNETIHFNLALALTQTGDLTNAEHEFKEALRLLPNYPEAHDNYGNLLVRLGRLDEAEQHLTEAVNEMPEATAFHNSLGVLRRRRNQTNEAMLSFQKAIQCDSNNWEAHYNLALAYLLRKNRDKGIAELRETLRIKPGFGPAQRILARNGTAEK